MVAKRGELVPRPPKRIEYEIRFATADAAKGWRDLAATIRNPLAEAWDFLTRTPLVKTPANYPLRGDLATITRGDKAYERWQHKPTLQGTARICNLPNLMRHRCIRKQADSKLNDFAEQRPGGP